MSQDDELRALLSTATSRRSFVLERALVVGTGAALLSRTPSLVPRTPQDQALISAGAGLMGAASGFAAEGAVAVLGRGVPGGRKGATVLLGGLAAGALAWAAARSRRDRAAAAADTAARVLLAAGPGGEIALSAYGRLPSQQRRDLAGKVWTTGLAAATAIAALRQKLAEPRDLVKASIRYDFLPSVSGGEGSLLPLERVDREGRKFLGTAVSGARIGILMGGEAVDPIRVFAGLESAETPAERARLAVAELERLGGLERSRILFLCPTGSGNISPIAVEAEELMSRGDVASVAVQYSHLRSIRARRHLKRARETWRLLLEELARRLEALPPGRRPEVAVYGESLGAQVVAEALFEGGAHLLTALNIARGLSSACRSPARRSCSRSAAGASRSPTGSASSRTSRTSSRFRRRIGSGSATSSSHTPKTLSRTSVARGSSGSGRAGSSRRAAIRGFPPGCAGSPGSPSCRCSST